MSLNSLSLKVMLHGKLLTIFQHQASIIMHELAAFSQDVVDSMPG